MFLTAHDSTYTTKQNTPNKYIRRVILESIENH